jgi:type II secretory pathway pseudopilin PulG
MRSGYSLVDLTVALSLMGIGVSILVPTARRQVDRNAVLAAREAVIAELALARRESRLSGGAVLQVRRAGGVLWVEAEVPPRDTLRLEERYGVRLEPGAASASLAFDALGIGRLANRTFAFSRGDASAQLVVSAYGRVRRQ